MPPRVLLVNCPYTHINDRVVLSDPLYSAETGHISTSDCQALFHSYFMVTPSITPPSSSHVTGVINVGLGFIYSCIELLLFIGDVIYPYLRLPILHHL